METRGRDREEAFFSLGNDFEKWCFIVQATTISHTPNGDTVCVCVCEWERETDRQTDRETEKLREQTNVRTKERKTRKKEGE